MGSMPIQVTKKGSVSSKDDFPFAEDDALRHVCNLFADVMETNEACNGDEDANGCPLWPKFVIPCFTEHKIEGQIYRAHPSYRDTGPWHDWVMVQYYDSMKREFFNVAGQIMFFIDIRESIIPFMLRDR